MKDDGKEWSNEELISYFRIHSRTDRALFAKAHVARLMVLSGSPQPNLDHMPAFIAVHETEADLLIKQARARMKRLRVISGGKK